MTRLTRLVLAGAVAGVAAIGVPAQAYELPGDCAPPECSYDCVTYPCYPSDWIDVLGRGLVTVEQQDPVVCVQFPCWQPMPVVVCVVPAAVCTPR